MPIPVRSTAPPSFASFNTGLGGHSSQANDYRHLAATRYANFQFYRAFLYGSISGSRILSLNLAGNS